VPLDSMVRRCSCDDCLAALSAFPELRQPGHRSPLSCRRGLARQQERY